MAALDKVLLVDDDETTLILCEFILERYDFAREIVKCSNGLEAFGFFENYQESKTQGTTEKLPQLIFLDLNMPVLSGWDFLDDLYQQFPNVVPDLKVVILSSTVDPKDFERSKQYSVVADFINKPLNQTSLVQLQNNAKLKPLFSEQTIQPD